MADDPQALRQALEEEKGKAERFLANWQRAQADFANLKRRTDLEKEEMGKFANSMLILNLLPALDDLERALDTVSTKLAGLTWVEGIRLIYRKLQSVLEAQGLSRIETEGREFDPNVHEAVMHTEGEEGKVVEELQPGYRLHDRVIRPAMVKVGSGQAAGIRQEQTEQEKETP